VSSTAKRVEYEQSQDGTYGVCVVGGRRLRLFLIIGAFLLACLVAGCSTGRDDAAEPPYPKPGGGEVGIVEPNDLIAQPVDINTPDVDTATTATVDSNTLDVNQAPVALSEANTVEASVPDANVGQADVNIDESHAADVNVAEANVPDVNVGETNVPDVNVGETGVLDVNVTEANVPDANVVEANKPQAVGRVTFHDVCCEVLAEYVDDEGMVKYENLDHRKQVLDTVLEKFAGLKRARYESWPKADKIAFWINAYNMQMLRILVDNYPIKSTPVYRIFWPPTSIRHIEPTRVLGVKKWDGYKFIVTDEAFTLSEIETRFFRQEFDEPRVFLAITHGTLSGPVLHNEPYYGYKLDRQLDEQVRRLLARPRSFKINRDEKTVYLSAMFDPDEYGNEFIDKYGTDKKFKDHPDSMRAVLNFISGYVSAQDRSFLETQAYKVKYIGYDWRLNDGSKKP